MRIEQLEYFVWVAHMHSINQASDYLHISQQALNRALKYLDSELGCALFVRSKKGIYLTDKGKQIYPYVVEALERLTVVRTLTSAAEPFDPDCQQTLLPVYVTEYVNLSIMPMVSEQYLIQYPHVLLQVVELDDSAAVIEAVRRQREAIGLIPYLDESPPLEAGLSVVPFYDDCFYGALAQTNELSHYQTISLKTLATCPIVAYQLDVNCSNFFLKVAEQNGIQLDVQCIANHMDAYIQIIQSGKAVGIFSRLFIANHPKLRHLNGVRFVKLKEPIRVQVGYVYQAAKTPKEQQLLKELAGVLKNCLQ